MSALDLAAVAGLVALAAAFLVRSLVRGRPPPCHPARSSSTGGDGDVVVGAALARGLAKARRADRTAPSTSSSRT